MVVDAETVRRNQLNAEMNPRETIYNEATQTLNPFTGRPYADGKFMPKRELDTLKNVVYTSFPTKERTFHRGFSNIESNIEKDLNSISRKSNSVNDEIELQKTLGRMGVREGVTSEIGFRHFLDDVEELTRTYAENPLLSLGSITDVNGLNAALGPIEFGEFGRYFTKNYIFEKPTPLKRADKKFYPYIDVDFDNKVAYKREFESPKFN